MIGRCGIEVFHEGAWHFAGEVHVEDDAAGFGSPGRFEYDFDYLDAMSTALGARDRRAVSCRYPLGYEEHSERRWPAFLLDLMPSGAARRFWEAELGRPNTPRSDWEILVRGGGNPPGNVRVREAAQPIDEPPHPGFARKEVIERREGFLEHARIHGAPVTGGSGAGGDSPKFLLREDLHGRWHADGALDDRKTKRAWLVKFPRSARADDRVVLRAEAAYHGAARALGVRTEGKVAWERDCLFVPRFDRVMQRGGGTVDRLGLESLYSLIGISDFGVPARKEDLAAAVARYTTDAATEVRELLLRDVLDVALGNTDNHGRNTAVLKSPDGHIALSPLYDFAPMFLDRQGIARVSRWSAESGGFPDYAAVADALGAFVDVRATKRWLRSLAERVGGLGVVLGDEGAPAGVIKACDDRIRRVAADLARVK